MQRECQDISVLEVLGGRRGWHRRQRCAIEPRKEVGASQMNVTVDLLAVTDTSLQSSDLHMETTKLTKGLSYMVLNK